MNEKVVVDKKEIDRLIRLRKYDDAYNHISHVRDVIELVVVNRVEALLNNKVILEKEKRTFYKIIKDNIINKLLEEDDYIFIDETYIKEKEKQLLMLKEKRKLKV